MLSLKRKTTCLASRRRNGKTEMLQKLKKSLAFWMIGLPMLLGIIYYTIFAADRYVSESKVTVKQSGEAAPISLSGIAQMLGGGVTGSSEETHYLREYIHSLDMLKYLDTKFDLRQHYGSMKLDPFYRLYSGVSQEWFLWYYRNRVEVVLDDATSLLTIRVQGFDPEFARKLNTEILAQSERFVNEISHKLAREQMAFAESETRKAQERFQAAKSQLIAFQNKNKVFDPQTQAQATAELKTQLDNEIAHKEAELKALTGYLQESTPQVVMARNEIAALKAQRDKETGKIASQGSGKLNTLASEYQNLTLEAGFAEEAYKAALTALETTRIEANRKLKNLVVVETPAKAETAEYPERLYNLVTLLVGLALLFGITRLIIATIEDHRD